MVGKGFKRDFFVKKGELKAFETADGSYDMETIIRSIEADVQLLMEEIFKKK